MELIDILDEKGNKTGVVKTKTEVHRDGLWHLNAHIWCLNSKNEILLQHRSEEIETYPDMWDISVAGHISSGEDSQPGALREVKEEIGVDLDATDLKLIGRFKNQSVLNNETYFDNEFNDVYLVKLDLDIDQLHLQKEELKALRWVPIAEFKKWIKEDRSNLVPHTEEYSFLLKYLELVG